MKLIRISLIFLSLIELSNADSIYKNNIDYIIILAWNYSSHIMKIHKQFKKNKGKFSD